MLGHVGVYFVGIDVLLLVLVTILVGIVGTLSKLLSIKLIYKLIGEDVFILVVLWVGVIMKELVGVEHHKQH
jgi:uncharacterized membrane protein